MQIESPRGLVEIERIAAASPRIETLIFGPGDYAASAGMPQLTVGAVDPAYPGDTGTTCSRGSSRPRARSACRRSTGRTPRSATSRASARSARRSRLLGFDGKWAIHPDQIAICNEIYAPRRPEFERAERILAAYRAATGERRAGRGRCSRAR